jgi:integrase
VRIQGPYPHEGKWRCRIITSAGRTWATTALTEDQAVRFAERRAAELAAQGSITVRDAIQAYGQRQQAADARPSTVDGTRRALTVFWTGMLDQPVGRITPRRAQEQYDQLQTWVGPRGHTLAVATRRAYLQHARTWGRWLVAKGWMKGPSPVDVVKGVGRKRKGKFQLSLDEARRLYCTALDLAQQEDEGATAVLMAISMGLRASEIVSRTPRDLDDGGAVLRVCDNLQLGFKCKNESAKRPVAVPSDLQPVLAQICSGKLPGAPLFPGLSQTGRRNRQWLHTQVRRICELAKVPVVCPHSLRGVSATAAAAAGALPELVSKMLGHTSPQMTLDHYIKPGTAEAAQLERGVQALKKKA